jgi:glutamate racemase
MIGVFDSGFGGLTVLKAIHNHLPQFSTCYLGDNARTPYGDKNPEEIYHYTKEGVQFLFDQGCPLVILACNTASAQALRRLQQTFLAKNYPEHRVLGVTRPTIEYLASTDEAEHLGIFATTATVESGAYPTKLKELFGSKHRLSQVSCPGLVELVEEGLEESAAAKRLIQTYMQKMIDEDKEIKRALLACTHYPLLKDLFIKHLPKNIEVLTQGDVVAKSLQAYFVRHPEIETKIDKTKTFTFYTTKKDDLNDLATKFYGKEIVFRTCELPS